jgi:putative ABC transport system substrate-binding protein
MRLCSRRRFLTSGLGLSGAGLLAGCGVLAPGSQTAGGVADSLKEGMTDLAYVAGQDYTIEARCAEGNLHRLPALAAELVRLIPEVIIAAGTPAIVAARTATSTIPIVMSDLGDPVGAHLIASLGRPGGNITGVSGMAEQLSGKRLELLKGVVPEATRFAAIWSMPDESMAAEYGYTRVAGLALGIDVQLMGVRTPDDFDRAYAAAASSGMSGAVIADTLMYGNRRRLVDLAMQNRLPTISSDAAYAAIGGLMSFGPNGPDQQRRTAYYVDKILKGAKPADLPVEQPKTFDFVINLKTAEALGQSIPSGVLQQSTELIQ